MAADLETREVLSGQPAGCPAIPDVADGLVQFVDGVADLGSRAMFADQPESGLELQSRAEQPADHHVRRALGNPVVDSG